MARACAVAKVCAAVACVRRLLQREVHVRHAFAGCFSVKHAFGQPWPDVINRPLRGPWGSLGFEHIGLIPDDVRPWDGFPAARPGACGGDSWVRA